MTSNAERVDRLVRVRAFDVYRDEQPSAAREDAPIGS
jgi:hypothetical protein